MGRQANPAASSIGSAPVAFRRAKRQPRLSSFLLAAVGHKEPAYASAPGTLLVAEPVVGEGNAHHLQEGGRHPDDSHSTGGRSPS